MPHIFAHLKQVYKEEKKKSLQGVPLLRVQWPEEEVEAEEEGGGG